MATPGSRIRFLLPISIVLALILMVYPLPLEWRWARPELLALLLIYWVLKYPEQLGVGLAFLAGLAQDLIQGSVLGQHAFALVIAIYICQLSIQRLRSYGMAQQVAWVILLVGLHNLFLYWSAVMIGRQVPILLFWAPVLISAAMWPLLRGAMDFLRRYFRLPAA